MMLEPGQIFAGRYQVIRLIAPGGMGAVFEAEHTGTERRVALKLLWPHVMAVQSAREKFEFEAKVAARVQSEHIVHVLDAGYDEATRSPYLVMELLPGGTLAELVEQEGRLSPELTVPLLQQVAKGLDAAHTLRDSKGALTPLIHRDLKPENLLIVLREDAPPAVKILDFGIAKVLSESRNMSHEIRGTPMYMAYEQVSAEKLSPQTDIWALGLIAYYMLTGFRYWKSANDPEATMQALFMEIVMAPLVPASKRLAEQGASFKLPLEFDAWLERCIDRTPAHRFESASAAIIALEAALRVKVSGARPALIVPKLRPSSTSAPRSMTVSVGGSSVSSGTPASIPPDDVAAARFGTNGSLGAPSIRSAGSGPHLRSASLAAVSVGAAASTVREPLASTASSVPGVESRPLHATSRPLQPARARLLLVAGALCGTLALVGGGLWWSRSDPGNGVKVGVDTLLPPLGDTPAPLPVLAPAPAQLTPAPAPPRVAPVTESTEVPRPASAQSGPSAALQPAPALKFQLPPLPADLMQPSAPRPAAPKPSAPKPAIADARAPAAAPRPAPSRVPPAPNRAAAPPAPLERASKKPRSEPAAAPLNPFDLR